MNLYRKKSKYLEGFLFTGIDSVPNHLRFENNKNGIMRIPLNNDCQSCHQPANNHGAYFDGKWERIICPGLYIIHNEDEILEVLTPQELKRLYEEIEVVEVQFEDSSKENGNGKGSASEETCS